MGPHQRRIAASLLSVIVFLIVFGSLYPFSFATAPATPAELARHLSFAGTTRSDVAANVLLYLPFGACLAWLAVDRLGGIRAVAAAILAGVLLSFLIEFAQLFETRRVTSLADVTSNTVGAFLGAWIAVALAESRGRPGASRFEPLVHHPVAAALVLAWIGFRLAPFAPVFDPAKWMEAFSPLAHGGWPERDWLLPHWGAWLVIGVACRRIAPERPIALAIAAMAIVLVGRVLFADLALDPAEIAGMAGALLLYPLLGRLPRTRLAATLAVALGTFIAIDGLAPFDFQLAQDRFALVPFGESLTQYRAANLADMFLRCFTNGALVWLLVQAGLSVLAAAATGGGAIFLIELLQTWLPAERAEITDPLLAIAAAGLIALFEPGREHRVRRGA